MNKFVLISVLLILLKGNVVCGQEMLGATLGNYSGINSIQLNPGAMNSSKLWLDVQLAGGDLFFQNNFLYLAKREFVLWDILNAGFKFPSHNEDYGTEVRSFYTYRNNRPKDGFFNLRLNGPGAMLIWGDHAFGIHTAVRSIFSFHNLSYDIANFLYLGLNFKPQQNTRYDDDKRIWLGGLSWFEAGISYAYKVYGRGFDRVDAGISIRKLFGVAGLYMVSDDANYIVLNDSTLQVNNLHAEFGLSLPMDYTSGFNFQTDPLTTGGGWGFDLGAVYTRLVRPHQKYQVSRLCEQPYEDYIYRIGISLIDVGGIRFNQKAGKYLIDNRASLWEDLNSFTFRSIDHLLDTISYKFYGNSSTAQVDDHFTLWLPAAISVQFDYHYRNKWYLNATLFYPVSLSKATLHRPAQLAITPRYESRWWEVNLPISLQDWRLVRLGLSLRLYFLTIGTEKLGQFFRFNDFTGLDFYFSIKIPFEKGVCRSKGSGDCPAYEDYQRWKL